MPDRLIVLRGAGDLATGVAIRLHRSGFPVVLLEMPSPIAVRRTVAFSEAVYDGVQTVEGITARLMDSVSRVAGQLTPGEVSVLVDPDACSLRELAPSVLVDATLRKRRADTHAEMAELVVGLGPGFVAGEDVHAVVETNRGPWLGRVYWKGSAEDNTGQPAAIEGIGAQRVLRAPVAGRLRGSLPIGQVARRGEVIATIDDLPVLAPFHGLVRGLARDGLRVEAGWKIGDLDPRLDPALCRYVSDKSLAIAGGVQEAIMSHLYGERRWTKF